MLNESILGVNVSTYNYNELINELDYTIKENKKARIVAINPEKIMMAREDKEMMGLINGSTYQIPDGVGILIASKLLSGKVTSRVTGVGLMEKLLELAHAKKYRIYLYGAKEEVIVQAKNTINQIYPDAIISGYSNGYTKDQASLINDINESKADILFVALGSPRQEKWIAENYEKLHVKVFQGVGGSFDVISGNVKRAPAFFQSTGLEWLYRLASQPSRFKRQLALPKFLFHVLMKK
jgi:N-acetylglucosaminyldiphosphoundecaprenol N-acetyl-beta-D-mannosaminyltransferase